MLLGCAAALGATVLGLISCLHRFVTHSRTQTFGLHRLQLLLIIVPDLVMGVAFLVFFNALSLPLGFFSLLIAHITFCLPFVVLTINSRLQGMDVNLYFSALDLGASRWTALRRVMLPLLFPAVMSAALLCFTLSFDDVVVSYFVAGPDFNVLPLSIYSLVRAGVTPELNALCSVTFGVSMVLVMLAHRVSKS